jgi:hypothetical protein
MVLLWYCMLAVAHALEGMLPTQEVRQPCVHLYHTIMAMAAALCMVLCKS